MPSTKPEMTGAGSVLRRGETEEHYEVRIDSVYGDVVLNGKDSALLDDYVASSPHGSFLKDSEVFVVHVKTRVIKAWNPTTQAWYNPKE